MEPLWALVQSDTSSLLQLHNCLHRQAFWEHLELLKAHKTQILEAEDSAREEWPVGTRAGMLLLIAVFKRVLL